MFYNAILIPALIIWALIMRIRVQTNIIVLVHAYRADIFFFVLIKYIICTFFATNIHIGSTQLS